MDVPFNCPKCGGALVYLYTVDDTLFYRCARDGPKDSAVRPQDWPTR